MRTISKKIKKIPINLDAIEAMTPETDKKVTGTFINIECPGQPAKICGRYYKGMPYFCKVLMDGEKAEIPYSVARYINERIYHEEHTHILDAEGKPMKGGKKIFRYKFMIEAA